MLYYYPYRTLEQMGSFYISTFSVYFSNSNGAVNSGEARSVSDRLGQ